MLHRLIQDLLIFFFFYLIVDIFTSLITFPDFNCKRSLKVKIGMEAWKYTRNFISPNVFETVPSPPPLQTVKLN